MKQSHLLLSILVLPCCSLLAQGIQVQPFATVNRAAAIYHLTEAPNGELAVADFGGSGIVLLSADGKTQQYQGGAFLSPSAIAFYSTDVGYTSCNPAPLASRAFCFSGSASCPLGAEGVPPGNQNGFSYPRYVIGTSGSLTSSTFFISNGGTGEIRLMNPAARSQSTVAGGFTVTNGVGAAARGPEQIVYDANAKTLYIADSGKNSVLSVNSGNGKTAVIRSGLNWPFGLVRLGNGNLLVSQRGDGTLAEIFTDGSLVATYDTGLGANALRGLALTSKGALFVLNDKNQTVYQVTFSSPSAAQVTTVDAASFRGTRLAPGAIAVAFGSGFGSTSAAASTSTLPLSLGGISVTITDGAGSSSAAPLYFAGPNQVSFLVPAAAAFGAGSISVLTASGAKMTGPVDIEPVGPGLFSANATGQGVPAGSLLRIRGDGTQTVEQITQTASANAQAPLPISFGPATDQLFLILYGTGIRGRSALSAVQASIGRTAADVLFAGDQGTFPGLDQVNLRLPRSLAGAGEVDLVLTVDGQTANTVRIAFQ